MSRIVTALVAALLALGLAAAGAAQAQAQSLGVTRTQSPHDAAETRSRLEAAIAKRGLKLFAGVDHAAAATEFGAAMPPTFVVIFGNPKVGTPMMLNSPEAAIDFPLKALVYEDAAGQAWLAFNAPEHMKALFERHGLGGDMGWYVALTGALTAEAVAAE